MAVAITRATRQQGLPIRSALMSTTSAVSLFFAAVGVRAADPALTLVRGPGDAEILELSIDDLAALPQVTIRAQNAFVDGEVAFRGPLARDVLQLLALGEAEVLRFTAANDYSVEIPSSDFDEFDAILAMEADGKPLSRRDKGPLWLMYPISEDDDRMESVYVHRLIWQVVRIESL